MAACTATELEPRVASVGMAAATIRLDVRSRQRVGRRVVIEVFDVVPRGVVVTALAAVDPELVAVGILSSVTASTCGGQAEIGAPQRPPARLLASDFAIQDSVAGMTGHALQLRVDPSERKPGIFVNEGGCVEADDVGVSPSVVRMTAPAVGRVDLPVEAPSVDDASPKRGMAREALLCRGSALPKLVTLSAVECALNFCMLPDERTRRNQLSGHRFCAQSDS